VYGSRVLEEKTADGLTQTVQPLAPARIWALIPPAADHPGVILP
jgi:hypothetical protein